MAKTRPVKRTREERKRQSMVSSSSSSSSSSLPALGSSQLPQKTKKASSVINISDDSDDEPAPKANPASKPTAKARKMSPAVSIVEISSDSDQERRRPKVQPKIKDRPKSPIEIIDVDALDEGEANPPLPPHTESDSSSNRGGIPDDPIILDEPLFLDDPNEPLFEPLIPKTPSSLPDELDISRNVQNVDDEMVPQLDSARSASGVLSKMSPTPAPSISPPFPPPLPKKRPSQQSTTLPRIPRAQTPQKSISIAVKGSPTTPSLPRKHHPRTPDQTVLSVKASPGSHRKGVCVFTHNSLCV
ncbi:hypothetical protein EDD18DRAFT_246538 [Armillaria luteobubalina]|uniref:Uncharacterized protein n=1 Tax=Armillaria luteobubalina TaxID=153913 RepID=A0AA39Q619_9AGAR|nr:hypothetical protein EDD18DRAFT_246538 [Armillaria luteobubalina]